MTKKQNLKKLWLYIPAVILAVISVYPMLWTICGSVNTVSQLGRVSVIPEGITFKNFVTIFTEYPFLRYVKNTFIYAFTVMLLSLLVNSLAAYALARLHFKGKDLAFYLIIATMMIPFTVTMIPLFVIIKDMGLINSYAALILPSLAGAYGIFMLRQFYLTIPKDLEDAAKIDGLSFLGIYLNIILPLSKPIMISLGMFAFLSCWNSYLWPLIINNDEYFWVLTTGIASFSADRNTDWNMILTGATLSMVPSGLLFAFAQKQLIEGMKYSGMKM